MYFLLCALQQQAKQSPAEALLKGAHDLLTGVWILGSGNWCAGCAQEPISMLETKTTSWTEQKENKAAVACWIKTHSIILIYNWEIQPWCKPTFKDPAHCTAQSHYCFVLHWASGGVAAKWGCAVHQWCWQRTESEGVRQFWVSDRAFY